MTEKQVETEISEQIQLDNKCENRKWNTHSKHIACQ